MPFGTPSEWPSNNVTPISSKATSDIADMDLPGWRLHPLKGKLWNGELEGSIIIDATNYIPTLEVNLTLQGLDYNRMADTFGIADLLRGQSQSIKLTMKGRGTSLHEILERAQGQFELINGPLELTNKYIDLWAADFFTTALSTAWEQKPVSKLNCAVGYFDIAEGELQSDNILIDTQRITIAAIGKLNLVNETMDFIFSPQPKDPSLFSLAHTVRIAGPVASPVVSSDKFRIAESGGWAILGLTNPVGWAITIPQVLGTTVGTMNQNPCVAALTSKRHTAQEIKEIRGGLWGKIKKAFTNLLSSDEPHPDTTP